MGKTDAEDVPGISLNDKHQKVVYSRPRVARFAAEGSATRGRDSCYFRPRADNKVGVQNQFILSMQGSHKLILNTYLLIYLSKILVQ